MAKRISQVSNMDADLANEVASNMLVENFANYNESNLDANGYPITPDIIFPSWSPATIAQLQRTIANDDPLHHYLDGVQLYTKIVKDKILVKLEAPLNFRNVISLIMDFAESKLVRDIRFDLEIDNGKSATVISNIDHNCAAEELVVKNSQLLYIILPVSTNSKRGYTLKWSVVLNGIPFELMRRFIAPL
jgi:hypothetical protein